MKVYTLIHAQCLAFLLNCEWDDWIKEFLDVLRKVLLHTEANFDEGTWGKINDITFIRTYIHTHSFVLKNLSTWLFVSLSVLLHIS